MHLNLVRKYDAIMVETIIASYKWTNIKCKSMLSGISIFTCDLQPIRLQFVLSLVAVTFHNRDFPRLKVETV